MWLCVYHIGVGSNVVCSSVSGNAKASIGGTDDRQFPRFFMFVSLIYLKGTHWEHVERKLKTESQYQTMNINLKETKKYILAAFTLALLSLVSITIISCGGTVNTTGSKFFTEDGECTEKVKTFESKSPANVKFYIEVSGSMNGFFRSNQSTKFKNDVWSVVTDFVSSDGVVNVFQNQKSAAVPVPVDVFRDGMNKGAFVSSSSTDVPDMISCMLDDVEIKSSEVGVLISEMKYDPVGNSALKALLTQYSTDIRNIMMRHPNVAVCLIAATSDYLSKDGGLATPDSPYYYLIVGNKANVVYMRNFIATLLNNNKSFVDEIEWGIDYMSPSVKVGDEDYLTEIEENKSYGDFDDECTIILDIDITDYPWTFENCDYLVKHLSIKSDEGTEAKIDTKNIKYEISYDDGKQLKRTAIAKVPVKIKDMYEESDVFEISLQCPDIQEPNNRFMRYLGSEDVNDITTTFSMEGLLKGFYTSMPQFRDAKPVHILISKK